MTKKEGKEYSDNGGKFEEEVANIINDKTHPLYNKLSLELKLDGTEVATADKKIIGRLKSGGNPKTDVVAGQATISCKKTTKKYVSAHEYDFEKFSEVLDPNNQKLKSLLKDFQAAGGKKALGKAKEEELTNELKPYRKKLVEWVLAGNAQDVTNPNQMANYLVINDDANIYVHSVEDYTNELLKEENEAQFGTPFMWTYPSKKKGEKIQLKCKIIK